MAAELRRILIRSNQFGLRDRSQERSSRREKKVVATLQDEHGQDVESEKVVEIDFVNGRPTRASDQFGKGAKR